MSLRHFWEYLSWIFKTTLQSVLYIPGLGLLYGFKTFYRASYASAVLAVVVCPSVCLSVRLSVCLSQAGIVSKRQHIESRKQRRTVAQGI